MFPFSVTNSSYCYLNPLNHNHPLIKSAHVSTVIVMKKIVTILSLILVTVAPFQTFSQSPDVENVIFNAILGGVFNLTVQDGNNQTAYFTTADDYNLGVTETQGSRIVPGFSTITMEATGNWYLEIAANDFMPTTGTGSIPINNLGVYCEATGVHQFGTEVTCSYQSPDAALGISNSVITLIDLAAGQSNSGSVADNEFVLHWLMGTMQGSMNPQSMFIQLAAGVFSQGTYVTTVVLTMTEIP